MWIDRAEGKPDAVKVNDAVVMELKLQPGPAPAMMIQLDPKRYLCSMNSQPVPVIFEDLGNMSYQAAWDYQEQLLKQKVEKKSKVFAASGEVEEEPQPIPHHFLLVEHPPVYTLGKSGKMEHVLISEEDRIAKGIEILQDQSWWRYHISRTAADRWLSHSRPGTILYRYR